MNINKCSIETLLKILVLFLFIQFIYSCEEKRYTKTESIPLVNIEDPYALLPYYKFSASITELTTLFENAGVPDADSFVNYPVSFHRLVYSTTYNGDTITVSGAINIPVNPLVAPAIICFNHGTTFADRDAPSNAKSPENMVPIFNNYIVFMPDYIGYGESKDSLHPYYLFEPTVRPVVDMIKAGKRYLDDNNIDYDHRLFLTGHSEGGYVTVAVQKELETEPVNGLKLTASAPSAGPYDMEETGNLILQNNIYPSTAYLILIFSAYNNYYWQHPITYFFQQPYASNISNLLNGSYNESEINQQLTTDIRELLNPVFLTGYRNDGEAELKESLKTIV